MPTPTQLTAQTEAVLDFLGGLAMPTRANEEKAPTCDRCGNSCDDGWITMYHGQADPETGYRDQEIICAACDEADGEFDAADAAYDMSVED